MKIHYVTMQFPARPEAFAINDVKELERRGVEVTVHSLRGPDRESEALIEERDLGGIRMSWFLPRTVKLFLPLMLLHPVVTLYMAWMAVSRNLLRPGRMARGLMSLPRSLEIYTAVHLERPDAVYLFWGHYPALTGLALRRYLPGIPVTMFLGAYDLVWGYGCTPPMARRADAVFTHAAANRETIEAFGVDPDRIRVVMRGVDFEAFDDVIGVKPAGGSDRAGDESAGNERFEALQTDGIRAAGDAEATPRRPASLVTVLKLVPLKRADRVIRVAALLKPQWPDLRLTVIGDGPERERLEALAGSLGLEGSVHFTGGIAHREVFGQLSRAETFLFLSQKPSERLPNVAKEAMACGAVPVVLASRGIRELIPDERFGVVLETASGSEPDSWSGQVPTAPDEAEQRLLERAAEAVETLWNDPGRAASMRRAGAVHVREQFGLQRSMQSYIDCWQTLTENE